VVKAGQPAVQRTSPAVPERKANAPVPPPAEGDAALRIEVPGRGRELLGDLWTSPGMTLLLLEWCAGGATSSRPEPGSENSTQSPLFWNRSRSRRADRRREGLNWSRKPSNESQVTSFAQLGLASSRNSGRVRQPAISRAAAEVNHSTPRLAAPVVSASWAAPRSRHATISSRERSQSGCTVNSVEKRDLVPASRVGRHRSRWNRPAMSPWAQLADSVPHHPVHPAEAGDQFRSPVGGLASGGTQELLEHLVGGTQPPVAVDRRPNSPQTVMRNLTTSC